MIALGTTQSEIMCRGWFRETVATSSQISVISEVSFPDSFCLYISSLMLILLFATISSSVLICSDCNIKQWKAGRCRSELSVFPSFRLDSTIILLNLVLKFQSLCAIKIGSYFQMVSGFSPNQICTFWSFCQTGTTAFGIFRVALFKLN